MNVERANVGTSDSLTYSVIAHHAIDDHAFMMMKEVTLGIMLGMTLFLMLFAREIKHAIARCSSIVFLSNDKTCEQPLKMITWIGSSGIVTGMIRNMTILYMVAVLVVINVFGEQLRIHFFSEVVASVVYAQRVAY
jgi:hypothetical protein